MSSGEAFGQNGDFISTSGGDYFTPGNWAGNTVASGAGNTADFSTIDLNGDASVGVDSPLTIGHLIFGDTNTATGGVWDFFTTNASVITLDAAAPTVTVNQLTQVSQFDDAFIGNAIEGTNGFSKNGVGIFTIGNTAAGLTGPINVNAGTLRFDTLGIHAGVDAPITLANDTVLEHRATGAFFGGVSVASGATATIRMLGGGSNFLNTIQGQGTGETLNLEFGVSGATYSGEGDWATGGIATVNMVGLGEGGASNFRGRINRPAPNNFSPNAFANTHLNLDNVNFLFQTNSFGNDIPIATLTGTATAALQGGGNGGGSAPRFIVGSAGVDSEFAGTVNGNGGLSLEKVGGGVLTLSGGFTGQLVGANTDIGRQGGVVRVSSGTLALTNTADNIPGGIDGTFKSTVDVLAGATLDVSGTTNTYTSSPFQQLQGSGTIVGPYNHVAGDIRPGDVSTVDNDTSLTNVPVPTAGTINFTGDLSFSGGTVMYDMNATPGGDDLISVTGTTSVSGGGVLDPNFLGAAPAAGLTYTFLTSSGGFSDSVSGWSVNWPGRGAKPSVFIDGNDLKFTTTAVGAGGDIVWSGAVSGVWDIETTQNWTNGGSPDVYFQGDNVTFDDTGSNVAVTLASEVSPGDVVVDSNANNYSFAGAAIVSSGSLTKRGTSTLTLGAANSFSSATIEEGVVDVGAQTGALGSGVLTLGSTGGGATITTTAGAFNNPSLVLAGGDNVIRSDNGTAFELPALSGSGNLTVASEDDALRLDLNGVDPAFTGNVTFGADPDTGTVSTMAVRINGVNSDFPNASVTLVNGAGLANQAGSSTIVDLELGALTGEAGTTLTPFNGGGAEPGTNWIIGNLNTDTEFAGVIQDGGNGFPDGTAISLVTKIGTGELTLSGLNTYTGDTTIEDGTLSITNAYLADTANVFIDGDAVLDLLFAGNDDVNYLYLNGVPQAPGVYNMSNSAGLIAGTGGLNVLFMGPSLGLLGDYNEDGVVDAIDYAVWRENLGAPEGTLPNDGGLAGIVGTGQYELWRDNFGAQAAAANATSTPEPASIAITGMLLAVVATRRRRR